MLSDVIQFEKGGGSFLFIKICVVNFVLLTRAFCNKDIYKKNPRDQNCCKMSTFYGKYGHFPHRFMQHNFMKTRGGGVNDRL